MEAKRTEISIALDAFKPIPQGESSLATFDYSHMTPQELSMIKQIVSRFRSMCSELDPIRTAQVFDQIGGAIGSEMCIAMDIATIHVNDRRLKLFQLMASDASDFRTDVLMIISNIDRTTGRLPAGVDLIFQENKH